MFAKVPVRFATYVRKPRSVLAGGEHYLIYPIYSIEINSVHTIICDSVGYLRVW